jgi:preprotein translocase subunit SecE
MAKKKKKQSAGAKKAAAKTKQGGAKAKQVPAKAKKAPAKAKKQSAKAGQAANAAGPWDKSVQFIREVVQELKRVTWPSRKQTISSTGVVLALVIIVSIFLGVVDFVLSRLVRFLVG